VTLVVGRVAFILLLAGGTAFAATAGLTTAAAAMALPQLRMLRRFSRRRCDTSSGAARGATMLRRRIVSMCCALGLGRVTLVEERAWCCWEFGGCCLAREPCRRAKTRASPRASGSRVFL